MASCTELWNMWFKKMSLHDLELKELRKYKSHLLDQARMIRLLINLKIRLWIKMLILMIFLNKTIIETIESFMV